MKKNYTKKVDTAREVRLWIKEVIIPVASMLAMARAFMINNDQRKGTTKANSYHQDFIVVDD